VRVHSKITRTRCPTADEIKKMWYLYMMEFYSAIKKNEILLFAGNWMELENVILREVSQVQKAKDSMEMNQYMEMSRGNSLYCYLKQTKMSTLFFTKMEYRRTEQVLSGGLLLVRLGRMWRKGVGV
jgi:hypothetical protein